MTSPLLGLAGAVPAADVDAGVAWHYGDPLGEQRRAVEAAAWVDRSHRDVLTVSGPDRLGWLHTLLSQSLTELTTGATAEALLLDPHGRVEEDIWLVDDGERTWLDVEPGHGPGLLSYLQRMVFWSQVEVQSASAGVVSVIGPDTAAVVGAADATPLVSRRSTWPAGGGVDLLVSDAELEITAARLSAAGATPMGSWGFEALRVEAGVPRLGQDADDKTIPHEVGWIGPAVHLNKGCYRGQETVARVQNLGRPPRRLALLQLDGSSVVIPTHGDAVVLADDADGRPVGWVGTPARHWELGPIALAVVKRQVDDGARLLVRSGERLIAAAIEPAPSRA